MDHKFQIYQYPQNNSENILNMDFDTSFGTAPAKPELSLGFIHFDHMTKRKTEVLYSDKLKGKTFYLVTHNFEHRIENHKEDLSYKVSNKFKLKNGWISRAAYKMWEMLTLLKITDEKKSMNMLHLAEAPGSFVQAIISYRDITSKKSSGDKHYVVSIKDSNKTVPNLDKLNKALSASHKKKVTLHKYSSVDIGDLTSVKTLQNIAKNIKKADLITADGGFNWTNENFQEQEVYRLLIGEIIGAVMNQAKDGHFVIKFFETFTSTSIKIVEILSKFYKNIFIYKPLTSRSSNSEKYIICESFKITSEKELNKYVSKLIELLEVINRQELVNNLYLHNICSKYVIPKATKIFFKNMNTNLMISQMKQINKMVNYINSENYFGDEYHAYKKDQIDATSFWYDNFIENPKTISYKFVQQIKKNKEEIDNDFNKYIDS